ncbi:MAG: hypothetical protein ACREF9_05710, partial [Opitutaceae bacterium]
MLDQPDRPTPLRHRGCVALTRVHSACVQHGALLAHARRRLEDHRGGADAPWELYNLANDRAETRNLATEQPQKLRELVARWEQETKEYRTWAEKDAPAEPPARGQRSAKHENAYPSPEFGHPRHDDKP